MNLDAALRLAERAAGVDPAAGAAIVAARLRAGATVADVANEATSAEPALRAAMIAELIRRGARDPRVDPRAWGEVESVGRYNGRHCSRVRRRVLRVWPGRLFTPTLASPRFFSGVRADSMWLSVGTPVLQVDCLGQPGRDAFPWRAWVLVPGGPWIDVLCAEEPDVVEMGAPAWPSEWLDLPVEAVEWEHSGWASPRPRRSTLAQWRRWAKGGAVLQLDCATRGLQ